MSNNNLFRNSVNQNQPQNVNDYYMMRNGNQQMNWRGQNNYINQTGIQNQHSALPGRVIFHPDQIFPQEIPTDGSPAIFPLMDGSCIIVRAIGPNGNLIDEQYALVRKDQAEANNAQNTEFIQVMERLTNIEKSLNSMLSDLYGAQNVPISKNVNQEGVVVENE